MLSKSDKDILAGIDKQRMKLWFLQFTFKGDTRRWVWPVAFNCEADLDAVIEVLTVAGVIWNHPDRKGRPSFTKETALLGSAFARACRANPLRLNSIGDQLQLRELIEFTQSFKED